MRRCVYCKNTGVFGDCLSGGESYCTCPVGVALRTEEMAAAHRNEHSDAIASYNRSIKAAHDELTSWIDALKVADFADTHDITEDEAKRAIELMRGVASKLE